MANNANDILFRCSSLGYLMVGIDGLTEKQAITLKELSEKPKLTHKQKESMEELIMKRDNKELPEGVKTHLIDVFVVEKYDRHEEISSKALDKGNDTEEDSITIISQMQGKFFAKNTEHLKNEFIKGTPDLFEGESIHKADRIRDAKSSWSIFSFNRSISKELNPMYYWQGQGYMALTGATVCNIDYCLNNTPWHILESELRRESYKYPELDTPAWIEAQIISNHTYDRKTFMDFLGKRGIVPLDNFTETVINGFIEVPLSERYFSFEFPRSEHDIQRLYKRIMESRNWMNENLFKITKNDFKN